MFCEFLKDQNNNIWFSNASQIHIRRIVTKTENSETNLNNRADEDYTEIQKKIVLQELQEYENSVCYFEPKGLLMETMQNDYFLIRKKIAEDHFVTVEDVDLISKLKQFKPNNTT